MKPLETVESFVSKAREQHGNRYDYSRVVYSGWNKKVEIVCKKHGSFFMTPCSHTVGGSNCPCCARKKIHYLDFMEDLVATKGDIYSIDQSQYKNLTTPIEVTCKKHNRTFTAKPVQLLANVGCPICCISRNRTTEDFIYLAREVHGDRYLYDKSDYTKATRKVVITCRDHGDFEQTPDMHINNRNGCPVCSSQSKYERAIYEWLCELFDPSQIIPQHSFNGYKQFRFDFYIPHKKVVIEYDGHHHFKKVNYSGKMTNEEMETRLEQTQRNDLLKDNLCQKLDVAIIRIPFYNRKRYKEIIKEQFNE